MYEFDDTGCPRTTRSSKMFHENIELRVPTNASLSAATSVSTIARAGAPSNGEPAAVVYRSGATPTALWSAATSASLAFVELG